MSNHTATSTRPVARHGRPTPTPTCTPAPERTPNPVASVIFCLMVLTGGAFAGHQWLVETCPAAPSATVQQVCSTVLG